MLTRLIPFVIIGAAVTLAQEPAPSATPAAAPAAARPGERTGARAPLFFHEAWKTVKGEHAATQDLVSSANLELKLYGPTANDVQALGNSEDPSNPPHVWTGMCTAPVAVALRDKDNYVDLTGLARIRWQTKVSGFHTRFDPVVKLADGTWLVGDTKTGRCSTGTITSSRSLKFAG